MSVRVDQLLGSWRLLDWQIRVDGDDGVTRPFGDAPEGLIVYTADGWMSAAIGRRERERLPADVPFRRIPPPLLADAYLSYFHYAGPYRIEGDEVIHSVVQSLNPNFPGTEQRRHVAFEGARLILSGVEDLGTRVRRHRLLWERPAPSGD